MKANIIWNSIGSIIYLGCQWLMTVVVVIFSTSYANAGLLAVAMAVGNVFNPLALYRIRIYQVSDVSNEFTSGQYISFRLITIVLSFIFSLVYTFITNSLSSFSVVVVFLFYKSVEAFIDVLHGIDQRAMRLDIAGISQTIRGILSISAFSLCLYFNLSLEVALIFATIPCLIVCIIYDCRKSFYLDNFKIGISFEITISLLKRCFFVTLALAAGTVVVSLSRQFLAVYGSEYLLGIYATLSAPVCLIQAGASYIYTPSLGPLSKVFYSSKRDFICLLKKILVVMLIVMFTCCAILLLFGEIFYSFVFGPEIVEYMDALPLLLLLSTLTAVVWFFNDLLVAVRAFRGNVIANISALICSVFLNFILIPAYGMNGASLVGIVSYLIAIIISINSIFKSIKN